MNVNRSPKLPLLCRAIHEAAAAAEGARHASFYLAASCPMDELGALNPLMQQTVFFLRVAGECLEDGFEPGYWLDASIDTPAITPDPSLALHLRRDLGRLRRLLRQSLGVLKADPRRKHETQLLRRALTCAKAAWLTLAQAFDSLTHDLAVEHRRVALLS